MKVTKQLLLLLDELHDLYDDLSIIELVYDAKEIVQEIESEIENFCLDD